MFGRVAVGLLILTSALFVSGGGAGLDSGVDAGYNVSSGFSLPECVIDLDCGVDGHTDYLCWNDFVVRDYVSYMCVGGGSYNATCAMRVDRDYVDWCHPTEVCVPGAPSCQPRDTHGAASVVGRAAGVCDVECDNDSDCGMPTWSEPYCGGDGSVYRDYVTFRCHNPGGCRSFCRHTVVEWRRVDYCGPFNRCLGGVCSEEEDWDWHVPEYECDAGEPCSTDGRIYDTCIGSWCFDVKTMYSEVDVVPGHIRQA